jgi:hypothetical protein
VRLARGDTVLQSPGEDCDARLRRQGEPGDSRATSGALLPLLARKTDRSWRESLEEKVRQ